MAIDVRIHLQVPWMDWIPRMPNDVRRQHGLEQNSPKGTSRDNIILPVGENRFGDTDRLRSRLFVATKSECLNQIGRIKTPVTIKISVSEWCRNVHFVLACLEQTDQIGRVKPVIESSPGRSHMQHRKISHRRPLRTGSRYRPCCNLPVAIAVTGNGLRLPLKRQVVDD